MSIKTYGTVTISNEAVEVLGFEFRNADPMEALIEAMEFALPQLQFRIRQARNGLWWERASPWARMVSNIFRTHRPRMRMSGDLLGVWGEGDPQ